MIDQPAARSVSWFKAVRSTDALELIRANPNAYALAAVIAHRARYREGFNADGLEVGDALIGDFKSCGLQRQEYRTALAQLIKWRFATTKPTSKGTIARLIDTRLFEIIPIKDNHQKNQRLTIEQPTANHRATTNIELENVRAVKSVEKVSLLKSKIPAESGIPH